MNGAAAGVSRREGGCRLGFSGRSLQHAPYRLGDGAGEAMGEGRGGHAGGLACRSGRTARLSASLRGGLVYVCVCVCVRAAGGAQAWCVSSVRVVL